MTSYIEIEVGQCIRYDYVANVSRLQVNKSDSSVSKSSHNSTYGHNELT